MDRWNRMVVKAYLPTAFALLVAFVSLSVVADWRDSPYLVGLVPMARWIPVLALITGGALFGTVTWRLLRWERGAGPMCDRCGGPLGGERAGWASRGGAYRKCLGCSKNVNHQHYE